LGYIELGFDLPKSCIIGIRAHINWVSKSLKLASTRTQAAMEEAMRALLAEQRQWMQDQIADQNQKIAT